MANVTNDKKLIAKEKSSPSIDSEYSPLEIQRMFSFLDLILDHCSSGIIIVNKAFDIIHINNYAKEMLDDENIDAASFFTNTILPQITFNTNVMDFKADFPIKINTAYRVLNILPPKILNISNNEYQIFIIRDITVSEKTEAEILNLKSNEEFLESIINNSYDGIYITDRDGLTLNVNESYERITGISRKYLIGRYMKDLVDEGLLSTYITGSVVEQKKPVTLNQTIRNGKRVTITGSPVFDENGEVFRIITNVRDITELINLEKKLKIMNETSNLYQQQLFQDIAEENIICKSSSFTNALELAKKVSGRDSTVLILGETGVGKDVIARYIHMHSKRKDCQYIKINCGAIPANLLESELFGYVAGAFTGASAKGKTGMFELAHGGTLFLDEIGEMPIDLQSSLLRVLQDGEIIKIGDAKSKKVNVRIIAATNRNLEEMISNGTFRSDLFYRLNVMSIYIPPLRERLDDIPDLAELCIKELNIKYSENKLITSNFIDKLMTMSWRGNVREMSNFIEKQFVMSDNDIIDSFVTTSLYKEADSGSTSGKIIVDGIIPLSDATKELESLLLKRALLVGRTTYKAAAILNISQPTFFRKYRQYFKDASTDETINNE